MREGHVWPGDQAERPDVSLPGAVVPPGADHRRLCVGMATYDDFDGAWFTIQAISMYQAEVLADVSFLVIDNHPEGAAGPALRALEGWLPDYRYVPFDGYRGTAVRDLVFREACADIVCCVDSHVLLRPGALAHLLEWFGAYPRSRDLLQGPLLYDDLKPGATHMEPTWGAGMFGQWGRDPRIDESDCEPFQISMQGLGLFACRRDAWPGLNPRLRGFGGEEGYLHEKFRQNGGRVLCHPQLGWLHRFSRPAGASYPNVWEDRVRNYYISWSEIGWDLAPMRSHFRELLGSDADSMLERAREHAEHPVNAFDGVFCLADGTDTCDSHSHLPEVSWRIEALVPGHGLGHEHRRLAGWRGAVSRAARRHYQHILLLDASAPAGSVNVPALSEQGWDLCLLPAADIAEGEPILAVDPAGSRALAGLAVAVHERAYKQLLADLPADEAGQAEFLAVWGTVDSYIARNIADGIFTAIQAYPAGPDADQPERAAGIEVVELAAGLIVRQAEPLRVHQLNNTAAVILELCDGRHTVAEIAEAFAEAFALEAPPHAEVAACVQELRQAGVLAGRAHSPAKTRVVTVEFTRQTAQSRRQKDQADDPFGFFEAIYCLNLDHHPDRWEHALRRFSMLNIATRVERFPAISTPQDHHVGCTRSWRLMVADARDRGLRNFLGIEDDAIFLDETLEVLRGAISELEGLPWDLLYLGGATWEPPVKIPGHIALQSPRRLACTHALAVNNTAYDRLLADIPEAAGIEQWITVYPAIDQYLAQRVGAGDYRAYVINPRVATQDQLTFRAEFDAALRDRYTIR